MIPKIKRFFPILSSNLMFLRKVVRTLCPLEASVSLNLKSTQQLEFYERLLLFSIIGASEKLAQSFSLQCNLSKELWIFEIPSVFPEHILLLCNYPPGGGELPYETDGVLVVSVRGVNFGFWSRLGCSGQSANILCRQGLV